MTVRCAWAEGSDLLRSYHDAEWGVPVHDDRRLFEMLNLEGAQAGLNWQTILARRDGYRAAFDGFDPATVARYDDARRAALLADARIIRNRLKIAAAVDNAVACLRVQAEHGSLDAFLWGLVDGRTLVRPDQATADSAGKHMSRSLKKAGFRFVGPTICYAFMQAVGMVDDHEPGCFRARPA
jgi:DNA-3-methyladenine glycosylase I